MGDGVDLQERPFPFGIFSIGSAGIAFYCYLILQYSGEYGKPYFKIFFGGTGDFFFYSEMGGILPERRPRREGVPPRERGRKSKVSLYRGTVEMIQYRENSDCLPGGSPGKHEEKGNARGIPEPGGAGIGKGQRGEIGMKKAGGILLCVFLLLLVCCSAMAEIPALDLSTWSVSELNRLREDIRAEEELHHTVSPEAREGALQAVKEATEKYFADQGIEISWAWYDWEYTYTRNMDFFTVTTHVDYRNAKRESKKSDVSAEVFYDGEAFHVSRLYVDGEAVYASDDVLPESLLIDTSRCTVNQKSGMNLSLLTAEELRELEGRIDREIEAHHKPTDTGRVNEVMKKTAEELFAERGITSVSWPWRQYEYTCDWDCYTVNTRVSYQEGEQRQQDVPVYAEVFPEGDDYRLFYLRVGYDVLLDQRDSAGGEKARRFLNKRRYETAVEMMEDGKYEEASAIFGELGDFDDSPRLKKSCEDVIHGRIYDRAMTEKGMGRYEEAIALLDSLGDFSDSREQAEECRNILRDAKYQSALTLMKLGNFEKAMELFALIPEYRDSGERIVQCRESISEREYQAALEKMNGESYEEAVSLFEKLEGYRDSAALAENCRERIRRGKYERAKALFEEAAYEEALKEYTELGEYQDSRERAEELREIIAGLDREILLAEDEILLFPNQKTVLAVSVRKLREEAAEESEILYSSGDEQVARVAGDGTVTALQPGTARIRCCLADNERIAADVTVHVGKNVNRILLSSDRVTLSLPEQKGNSTALLTFRTEPEDAWIQTGSWSSGNEKAVVVDQEGNIRAVGIGRAVITFLSDDSVRGKRAATCTVNVVQAVTSLELPENAGTVYVGKTVRLQPVIGPKNAGNKKLVWTSDHEETATVNADGYIRGISPGTAVITGTSADGLSVQYTAEVRYEPVTLKVTGKAKCIARNHVGKRWKKEFSLNGEVFQGTGKATVENGDVITVGCKLWEADASPEYGSFEKTIEITPEILQKGTVIQETVLVTENEGKYAGNTAEWRVTITLKP